MHAKAQILILSIKGTEKSFSLPHLLGDTPNRIEDVRKPKSQKERRTSNKMQMFMSSPFLSNFSVNSDDRK